MEHFLTREIISDVYALTGSQKSSYIWIVPGVTSSLLFLASQGIRKLDPEEKSSLLYDAVKL